ncbi:hypothetical protein [Burkholderia orbicola]|uniref:hypothetical protein n=1 Tax=Burkholderia orbicola TaxID=2978683 RepID=UPI002FE0CFCF
MNEIKHTPGPWHNREGEIIADTRTQTCCGSPVVGGEYMGQQEMVCCGCPELDGSEEDVIARVTYENDIPVMLAAPDMAMALELIATDADAGNSRLTSGVRMALDAALIKAGRKEAPVRTGE